MKVLSVDLAYRRHQDIGVALVQGSLQQADVRFLPVSLYGDPKPDALAEHFSNLAYDLGATLLLVDGPQAWKSPSNGLAHSRLCEKKLNTPAKTGLPGSVKPANYGPFVEFSIAFFDQLSSKGWPRLRHASETSGVTVETFPLAAWRSLGLATLPAKAKTTPTILRDRRDTLLSVLPARLESEPNHDELQALVAGFAGLAIARGETQKFSLAGESPFSLESTVREGFIACPTRGRTRSDG